MAYTAKDIGRRMVQLSIDNGIRISNLKLQKLLYFAWLEHAASGRGPLFKDEEFQAWKYGPVVPSVYYDFWRFAGNTIMATFPPSQEINKDTSDFLLEILREYKDVGLGRIVEKSHESSPWKRNYVPGEKNVIPYADMEAEARRPSI